MAMASRAIERVEATPCVTCSQWSRDINQCNQHGSSCFFIDRTSRPIKKLLIKYYRSYKRGVKKCVGDFGMLIA